jgi:excisionase family DNA binding protein
VTEVAEYTLTTRDVAEAIGASITTVARHADAGTIPSIRTLGGWRKFRPADIDAFVAERIASGGVS